MSEKINWINEKRKVVDLMPADYNPRKISETKKDELLKSLEKLGMIMPIIINRDNKIIGGHQRIALMRDLNIEEVDVRIPDRQLTEQEEKEANLTTNISKGEWDWSKLIDNFDFDLMSGAGFGEKEISDQMDLINVLEDDKEEFDIEKELEKADETLINKGDIFSIGKHRLMCGDSTSIDDATKLMGGGLADMVFTDPPYNFNYKGRGDNTKDGIKNDNMSAEDFNDFITGVFKAMITTMRNGATYYICSGIKSYSIFVNIINEFDLKFSNCIVWIKNIASMGWNDYRYRHEFIGKGKNFKKKGTPIFYGYKEGKHYFRDTRDETDIWEMPRKQVNKYVHPTEKPEWLIMRAIKNSSIVNQTILDLFGGSGSTMMACEKTNRINMTMELDPKFCHVILERLSKYLKIDPIREDGKKWSEIKNATNITD